MVTTSRAGQAFYDGYLEEHKAGLLGHYLLSAWFPGRLVLKTPYPPSDLTDEELQKLKDRLNERMPRDSIFLDLWGFDVHFEDDLGEDWYFEAAFGDARSTDDCAEALASFFLMKVDEYDLDYNQESFDDPEDERESPQGFEDWIRGKARDFIIAWRQRIFAKYAQAEATTEAPGAIG